MAESDHPHITCPVCGMTSYHPVDIAEGYCGNCHAYTSPAQRHLQRWEDNGGVVVAEPEEVKPNPNRLCASPYCVHARSQHTRGKDGGCQMCECPGFHPVWLG